MPSNEEHAQHSQRRYGVSAEDLHRWMDEPSFMYRGQHRRFRHNPDHPPQWAVEKYGFETAQNVMLDHIYLDRKANNRIRLTTSYGEWKPSKIRAGAGVPYNPTGLEKLIYKPTPVNVSKLGWLTVIWLMITFSVMFMEDFQLYYPIEYMFILVIALILISAVMIRNKKSGVKPEVNVEQEPRNLDDDEDLETLVLIDDLEEELEDDEYFEQ